MVDIHLDHIYKKYPNAEHNSVTDFNLKIKDREFIVFVGPSGCGKSTTLRMIAGLEDITQGELYINHQLMNEVEPKDRDIAMVFQNYALYPHMTVYDNMAYGLKLRKYSKEEIDSRVKNAAEILGLTLYLKRKPAALSGGQRQRVALGRAIVRDAKVFLMDEPLSNLDAKLRVQMRSEMAKLHQRLEATTIYVTHDQTEAMTLASRIVVMKDGIVQQIGTPEDVYNRPLNIFVASFMGSPAMNFFDVKYANGRITSAHGIDFQVSLPSQKVLNDKGYHDKEIVLGIRPEDLHVEQIALESMKESILSGTVSIVELTGSEVILHLNSGGEQDFIARTNPRYHYNMGDTVELGFDMNKVHYFDKQTEQLITR